MITKLYKHNQHKPSLPVQLKFKHKQVELITITILVTRTALALQLLTQATRATSWICLWLYSKRGNLGAACPCPRPIHNLGSGSGTDPVIGPIPGRRRSAGAATCCRRTLAYTQALGATAVVLQLLVPIHLR